MDTNGLYQKLVDMHEEETVELQVSSSVRDLMAMYGMHSPEFRDLFRRRLEERIEKEFPHPHYEAWIHEGNGPWNNAIVCRECGFKIRIPESYAKVYRYCPVCGTSHGKIVEEGDKDDET